MASGLPATAGTSDLGAEPAAALPNDIGRRPRSVSHQRRMSIAFSRYIALVALGVSAVACARGTSATSTPGELQIFLLAGQSNMAGRGKPTAQDSVENPRVLALNRAMAWVLAVDPLHWDKPAIVGVGPGRSFGLAIATHDPGARIGLVPAAVGGSPISSWAPGVLDPATKTHPYDDALARMRVALRAGKVRAILWHQGESDATPALSVLYAARLRALIDRFRTDLGDANLPFVIGQLGRFDGKPWSESMIRVDSVHRALAASVPHVAYVSSEGLHDRGDTLHFDAASARALGERYAAAYLEMVKR